MVQSQMTLAHFMIVAAHTHPLLARKLPHLQCYSVVQVLRASVQNKIFTIVLVMLKISVRQQVAVRERRNRFQEGCFNLFRDVHPRPVPLFKLLQVVNVILKRQNKVGDVVLRKCGKARIKK
jgi:hypothetical protein